ncbi:CAP domain-containing protein [Clostridium sediminicola]|uniref:CAP domain-containing protein n=1 Tax=Clostridium sediminicola TaxID=3114879 RepID=UPI0031F1E791
MNKINKIIFAGVITTAIGATTVLGYFSFNYYETSNNKISIFNWGQFSKNKNYNSMDSEKNKNLKVEDSEEQKESINSKDDSKSEGKFDTKTTNTSKINKKESGKSDLGEKTKEDNKESNNIGDNTKSEEEQKQEKEKTVKTPDDNSELTDSSDITEPRKEKSSNEEIDKENNEKESGVDTTIYSTFENKVIQLVNRERAKAGLGELGTSKKLCEVARLKSQDMIDKNYFSHTSPTYGAPFDMISKFGITYMAAGENIAYGQTTPEQVMDGWMNSDGHRSNILKSSFSEIGVGVATDSNGRYYWTQMFIGK